MCVDVRRRTATQVLALVLTSTWVSEASCVAGRSENAPMTLGTRQSGYGASVHHWRDFFACWVDAASRRHRDLVAATPDLPFVPLLGKYSKTANGKSDIELWTSAVSRLEKSLGTDLPRSYKDFLHAYQPPQLKPIIVPWGTTLIGFFSPDQVGTVADVAPELLSSHQKHPIQAGDKEYFVYGIEQDTTAVRTRNLKDAIRVGKYGDSAYEILVLYPQVRTADGEMEAAMQFQTGEFRAPSFAELMRQISFMEGKSSDQLPPFPQIKLHGTCSDKIPMSNVWWK